MSNTSETLILVIRHQSTISSLVWTKTQDSEISLRAVQFAEKLLAWRYERGVVCLKFDCFCRQHKVCT